jgi:hypothetical protein
MHYNPSNKIGEGQGKSYNNMRRTVKEKEVTQLIIQ